MLIRNYIRFLTNSACIHVIRGISACGRRGSHSSKYVHVIRGAEKFISIVHFICEQFLNDMKDL